MNYFNTQQDKGEDGKYTYTLTHVTDDKVNFKLMQHCARMAVDNRTNACPFISVPYALDERIYWVVGDITDRQIKDLCVVYDEQYDIGVVKFTVSGYIYNKNGIAILVKEIPYHESVFALNNKDQLFSDLESAEKSLHDWALSLWSEQNSNCSSVGF